MHSPKRVARVTLTHSILASLDFLFIARLFPLFYLHALTNTHAQNDTTHILLPLKINKVNKVIRLIKKSLPSTQVFSLFPLVFRSEFSQQRARIAPL